MIDGRRYSEPACNDLRHDRGFRRRPARAAAIAGLDLVPRPSASRSATGCAASPRLDAVIRVRVHHRCRGAAEDRHGPRAGVGPAACCAMDGSEACARAIDPRLCRNLERIDPAAHRLWDERLSTVAAERALLEATPRASAGQKSSIRSRRAISRKARWTIALYRMTAACDGRQPCTGICRIDPCARPLRKKTARRGPDCGWQTMTDARNGGRSMPPAR